MRNLLAKLFLGIFLAVGVLYALPASPLAAFAEAAQKWTCPMHPEVVSDQPGKCPKCGMNLVLMEEKGPEHKHHSGE